MATSPSDFQKCPTCDEMVDPAFLGDVVFHFFDGACVTGAERSDAFDGIHGEKVAADA